MLAKKCTMEMMEKALAKINEKYKGNIRFYEMEQRGKNIKFRLKTNSPKLPGVARSASWKRSGSGCWHVHGDFFEALLSINPEAVIITKISKITKDDGNWVDVNIGSQFRWMDASEACDCNFSEEILNELGTEEDFIKHIKGLDVNGVSNLLDMWGHRYGKLILMNCIKEVLPLYINDEELGEIATKRLASRRAA